MARPLSSTPMSHAYSGAQQKTTPLFLFPVATHPLQADRTCLYMCLYPITFLDPTTVVLLRPHKIWGEIALLWFSAYKSLIYIHLNDAQSL